MDKRMMIGLAVGLLVILGGLVGIRTWQYAGSGTDASGSADDALETLRDAREAN